MPEKQVFAAGLDAGSRTTRLVVCAFEKGRLRFLGSAAVESQGWVKGRIADQRAVTDCIVAALREAEAVSGVSVGSVVAGIGGLAVRGHNAHGALELGYLREVDQSHVNRVLDHASRVQMQDDRMLLHLFPQDFVADGHAGYRDPRKMLAAQLEVNVHLITASEQEHTALVGAINQAHLLVEETVFEALAACYAAVLPEERRQGIAVVDIGAHSTEMAAYYGDGMYLASTAPICGDHFTADLAQALRVSFDEAETVKVDFGGALAKSCQANTWVELPTPDNRERRETTCAFVNQVLEARCEDLFRFVHSELVRVGMEHALLGGVFLTGAAARLPDLCDVAARVLLCQTRYGLAVGIEDWPDALNDPEWCVAAGLAMYSAKLKAQAERQRATAGWLGKILK
jgi:cell division protein FtsA